MQNVYLGLPFAPLKMLALFLKPIYYLLIAGTDFNLHLFRIHINSKDVSQCKTEEVNRFQMGSNPISFSLIEPTQTEEGLLTVVSEFGEIKVFSFSESNDRYEPKTVLLK